MNTTELVFHLQDAIMRRGYSTTAAWQNEARDGLTVIDSLDEGDFFTEVTVTDPEAKAFKIVRYASNRVIHQELELSNLPISKVAEITLIVVND